MNAPFSQVERLGRLTTVLGDDVLVLLCFAGSDHVNALFEYRVEALAANAVLDSDELLGTPATVSIDGPDGDRHFNGTVTRPAGRDPRKTGIATRSPCAHGAGWRVAGAISASFTARPWCRS